MDELEQLRKKLEIAIAALKVYADKSNWKIEEERWEYGVYFNVKWDYDIYGNDIAEEALNTLQESNE